MSNLISMRGRKFEGQAVFILTVDPVIFYEAVEALDFSKDSERISEQAWILWLAEDPKYKKAMGGIIPRYFSYRQIINEIEPSYCNDMLMISSAICPLLVADNISFIKREFIAFCEKFDNIVCEDCSKDNVISYLEAFKGMLKCSTCAALYDIEF